MPKIGLNELLHKQQEKCFVYLLMIVVFNFLHKTKCNIAQQKENSQNKNRITHRIGYSSNKTEDKSSRNYGNFFGYVIEAKVCSVVLSFGQ